MVLIQHHVLLCSAFVLHVLWKEETVTPISSMLHSKSNSSKSFLHAGVTHDSWHPLNRMPLITLYKKIGQEAITMFSLHGRIAEASHEDLTARDTILPWMIKLIKKKKVTYTDRLNSSSIQMWVKGTRTAWCFYDTKCEFLDADFIDTKQHLMMHNTDKGDKILHWIAVLGMRPPGIL